MTINQSRFSDFIKKNIFFLGLLILCCYYMIFIVLGNDSYWIIHDFLDDTIPHYKIFKNNYSYWDIYTGKSNHLGFDSSNIIVASIYYLAPNLFGILVNDFIVRIIAYLGMFLLCRDYLLPKHNRTVLSVLLAVSFAFIPFYSNFGLSSAGIPLLIWAFLNVYHHKHLFISYLSIFFFALYTQLTLSGWCLIGLMCIFLLYRWICDKKISRNCLYGILLLTVLYVLTNSHLFYSYFVNRGFVPHRVEFCSTESFKSSLISACKLLVCTHYHSGTLITLPIFLAVGYMVIREKRISSNLTLMVIITILAIVFFSFLYHIIGSHLERGSMLLQFQFDRFYFLLPTLWIILLAIVLQDIIQLKTGNWILGIVIVCVLLGDLSQTKSYTFLVKKYVFHRQEEPTFRQFYDEELFSEIKSNIQSPSKSFKVASIGISPAVAQYNGFECIDGYWNIYPSEYKHEFRKIIAKELDKNDDLKNYFDNWGSRCYVFSSELGTKFMYGKNSNIAIKNLDIDTRQLQEMNCQYIFSAVPILNYENLNLKFEKSFTTDNSFWKIYLYSIPLQNQSK